MAALKVRTPYPDFPQAKRSTIRSRSLEFLKNILEPNRTGLAVKSAAAAPFRRLGHCTCAVITEIYSYDGRAFPEMNECNMNEWVRPPPEKPRCQTFLFQLGVFFRGGGWSKTTFQDCRSNFGMSHHVLSRGPVYRTVQCRQSFSSAVSPCHFGSSAK